MSVDVKRESIFKKGALEGNFGARVDKANKRVYLDFTGYFDVSCAEKFLREYNNAKTSVDLSQTTLCILAKNLKPFPQDSLDAAGEIYKDYLCFKDIILVEPENAIAKMQIHRVLKNNKIEDRYKFVNEF